MDSESNATSASAAILAFQSASFELTSSFDNALADVSFELREGELLLVRLEREFVRIPLADGASGLISPTAGQVRFLGEDWTRMSPGQSCRQRGQIGRVFEGPNWVSNLDVDENVILAQRHHTRRSDVDLLNEATALARSMGLPEGLPSARPASIGRLDLARSSVVRALMGKPRLLLLERPEAGVNPEILADLIAVLTEARKRGTAVLWTTNYHDVWSEKSIRPTRRAVVHGSTFRLLEEPP